MEVRPFIEQLEQFEDRTAGGVGERAAQEAMAGLLQRRGYLARVEGCVCHTNPALLWLAHGLLLVAGGLLAGHHAVDGALAGLVVTGVVLVSLYGETVFRGRLLRWFVPKEVSSNLIARMRREVDEDTSLVVFVAHGDVARRGLIHNRWLGGLFHGAAGRLKTHPMRVVLAVAWAQVALILLRLPGIQLEILDRFLLVTVGFFALIVLLALDWMRPRPARGANDNASGLAVLAALSEHFAASPLRNAEVVFLVTGSREADCGGMDAFLTSFGRKLPRARTFVINLDDVGAGDLHFATGERVPGELPYHPLMPGHAAALARTRPFRDVRPVRIIGLGDAGVATRHGYAAVTLKALRRGRPATPVHTDRDRIRHLERATSTKAFRFAIALAERVDAELAHARDGRDATHDGEGDDPAREGDDPAREEPRRGDRTADAPSRTLEAAGS